MVISTSARLLPLGIGILGGCLAGCVVDPSQLADSTIETTGEYRYEDSPAPILPPGRWWDRFNDAGLNELIERLDAENPSLEVALARYDRSRAELGLARADRYPAVTGDLVWKRKRDSSSGVFVPPEVNYSEYRAALNLNYEIDLWGRVRQTVNAAEAELQAAEADWAAARVSLRSELARTYFQLRYIDSEIEVLTSSLALRQENLDLVSARVRGGETTDLDVARAETELEATRAQRLQLERSRAEFFNALSALCGELPATFRLPDGGVRSPPSVPAGLPSILLTRRPDIVAAEAKMRAAAARIGVAKASFLPRVTLGATGGVSSLDLGSLFEPSSLFGEIGPNVEIPIYQGGRAGGTVDRAFADSDEAVGLYRETVLGAFREVEDALAGIRFLDREIVAHRRATSAADRAAELSRKRYGGGFVSYLEVVDAQRTALAEKRELVQARSARLLATVQLVQALGGGWEVPVPESEVSREYVLTEP